jgi:hypothetical protein
MLQALEGEKSARRRHTGKPKRRRRRRCQNSREAAAPASGEATARRPAEDALRHRHLQHRIHHLLHRAARSRGARRQPDQINIAFQLPVTGRRYDTMIDEARLGLRPPSTPPQHPNIALPFRSAKIAFPQECRTTRDWAAVAITAAESLELRCGRTTFACCRTARTPTVTGPARMRGICWDRCGLSRNSELPGIPTSIGTTSGRSPRKPVH